MNKFEMNGVTFADFGENNYTNGMHLVSVYPMPENMVQDVLDGKYPGIYLNPSSPCDSEFFGVLGTPEQYSEFYKRQREARISSQVISKVNLDWSNYKEVKSEIETNYKDWWEN